MSDPVDLLAFGAHPDDVEIGAGGAVAAAAARGKAVVIVDLTRGEMSSAGDIETRAREAENAARHLGVAQRLGLGLPDAALENEPRARLRVLALIRHLRPRIVLAPCWEDRHPDHRAAAALVRDACFLAGVRRVGEGPAFRPLKIYHYTLHEQSEPDLVLDISAVWSRKRMAVAAYRSQFERTAPAGVASALNEGGFVRAIEARAVLWGSMIGACFGEAYRCRGPVPASTLPVLENSSGGEEEWVTYSVP